MNGIKSLPLIEDTDQLVDFAKTWQESSWVKQRELEWKAGYREPKYKKPQIVFYSNDYVTFDDAGRIIVEYGLKLQNTISEIYQTKMQLSSANLWHVMSPVDNELRYSQLWHRDPAMGNKLPIKVFLWCHAITEDNGPFQYALNSRIGEKYWPKSGTLNYYPPQDEVINMLQAEDIVTCTTDGVVLTVAETIGLHRGGTPRKGFTRLCGVWAFYQADDA